MVRRHRLLETFQVVRVLNYGWGGVRDEAEILEHGVSGKLIAKIDSHLDRPTRDPHGEPMPSLEGQAHRPEARQLSAAVAVTRMRI
ncbi:iron dependent repressor, metal binding and dimerization domain protein [Glutamicibacter ardleyensis]|uniref:Iron dependent repressor metal binding and dimerisation domain-containing protein n=1 Tax=Glutamicibacter ardleyensis TaxID=225894 RepID=A0ABQ2DMA9_9MICC|nr:iron dependent repressor, metal binding and dimerization domain protein [Glutamicibacter ardleyensis]GGJ64080.1 hypothetical protein GCM10007173_23770 [Glutamicibacter ardleyensis]